MRYLARRLGLRRRLIHQTKYAHPINPWDAPSWDPDPTEIR